MPAFGVRFAHRFAEAVVGHDCVTDLRAERALDAINTWEVSLGPIRSSFEWL
jgi:hypothetical protein